jgi:hypothetical protein
MSVGFVGKVAVITGAAAGKSLKKGFCNVYDMISNLHYYSKIEVQVCIKNQKLKSHNVKLKTFYPSYSI